MVSDGGVGDAPAGGAAQGRGDPECFEGGGEAAAGLGEPVLADGPGGHGGLLVDEQVQVGGAGPAVAAVLQPGQQQAAGQVVERAGLAGDGDAPVAEVGVVQVKFPDGLGPGRVDGGQGDREAVGRGDRGCCGLADFPGSQRLDDDQRSLAVADACGGVPEDPAGLLAVAKQRPQGGEGLAAPGGGRSSVAAATSAAVTSRRWR
jgi:hypothetical protein